MSLEALRFENASFAYAGSAVPAFRDLNWVLPHGQAALLVGPSGSGKSTVALAANGLIPHAVEGRLSGRVLVNGRDTTLSTAPQLAQEVGLVFQDPELQFCCLSVEEEVAFGPENLCLPPAEISRRIKHALTAVGIAGLAERRIDRLSGGEKQRLALACALAMGALTLVCDEPTANIDPAGAADLSLLFAELRSAGRSLLLIEHRMDDVIGIADQILAVDASGAPMAAGPTRDVIESYAEQMRRAGVWLPFPIELGLAMRRRGLHVGNLPKTINEAANLVLSSLSQVRSPSFPTPADTLGRSSLHPAVRVADVTFAYPNGTTALNGVNLCIGAGEFAALVGPNGSGKSTLALAIAGILTPQKGHVELLGRAVSDLSPPELRRCLGYVFQNPEHQFVTKTVRDELAYGLSQLGLTSAEVEARVSDALERFDLADRAHAHPYRLSQGEKRRLSVAAMLTGGQQVLLLDEPTYGQDRAATDALVHILQELNRSGTTIVVITHDMQLVAECATSVVVMLDGRILFQGTPRQLFANHKLLNQAGLRPPPAVQLSSALCAHLPGYPLLTTAEEHLDLLDYCRRQQV
ncbi:MAG: ABC transporter ATP-binding protein [Armatimonadota bacterium]